MSCGGGASRRAMFLAAGAAGAVGVLAACGDDPGSSRQPTAATTPGDPVRIPIAFVPIGGGYIDFNSRVIVTQPEAGQFRGFDAYCTHARCFITWVADGLIKCPCHGSEFRIADGSVARGPATRSLDTRTVRLDGDDVLVS